MSEGEVLTLPSRRRRPRTGWIVGAAVVLLLAVFAVVLFLTPVFSVKAVVVKGERLSDEKSLASALQPLVGTPIARVNNRQVLEALKGQPAVQDVRLGVGPGGSVIVNVLEHREVAVLKDGEATYLVGDNGARLKRLGKEEKRELPQVSLSVKDPDGKIFDTVVAALAEVPEDVLAQLQGASATSVDTVSFTLEGGRTVIWGDASQGALKAAVLRSLLGNKAEKAKTIDVSTPDRPVTR